MKFHKKTINDVPIKNKTVLLRADYNVPLTKKGEVHDDFRIRASLPTLQALRKEGCKVVIVSHLGRPEGKSDASFSLAPVAVRLSELLKTDVLFVDDTTGEKARMTIKKAPKHSVILLENLRFHPEEETNDKAFAKKLAKVSGAKYFVQDGFGVVHRDHTSTAAITEVLPSVAGLLLQKEYTSITNAIDDPKRPLVAVMGGAKVSDKIAVIERLVERADTILIGGAMANTFLSETGTPMGKSKYERDQKDTISRIMRAAEAKVGKHKADEFIRLPIDVATDINTDGTTPRNSKPLSDVTDDDFILDIGNETARSYASVIRTAGTVIWNGTMGMAEVSQFAVGSSVIAHAIADTKGVTSIVGGGDTADYVLHWDEKKGDSFTHVSTGGGASLELMAGNTLPGIEHLLDA